jgi:hemerythrin-like domain-containing protein
MLTSIKAPVAPKQSESALDLLLGCHQRIRHFTEMALRVAESSDSSPAEIAAAAAAVHRYYTVGLPLHEADEDQTVYPRLARLVPAGELAAANQAMFDQHRAIDSVIAALVPLWSQLIEAPESISDLRARLLALTAELAQLWHTHLALEEDVVFPALARHISESELATVAGEMKARREPSPLS